MQGDIALSSVVGALSYALDITEGQPEGHALRSSGIGMRIAQELALPGEVRSDLFYALLLKDAGCSVRERVARLRGIRDEGEVTRKLMEARCDGGAEIARMLHLSEETAPAIRSLDEQPGRERAAGRAGPVEKALDIVSWDVPGRLDRAAFGALEAWVGRGTEPLAAGEPLAPVGPAPDPLAPGVLTLGVPAAGVPAQNLSAGPAAPETRPVVPPSGAPSV